jgi:hypothetical protein
MNARRDPIVDEVRKHRAAIAREHGNRIEAILRTLQREEADWPAGTVSRPPKELASQAVKPKRPATRRPNKRMEPTRSGSRKRAAHS